MDVDYPYPIKGKIGMTATLSYDWLKSLIVGSYAPRNLKLKLTSRTICFIDVRTGYKNVKFYRSFSWTDIDTYKVFMDRSNIRRWAEYYPRLGHLIYFEARKDFLREEAEHGLRMGAHVFANQICEIHDIVKRGCNALIVYGTRNQMLTVADAIYRSVGRWIGAYYYMRWSKPKVDLDQGYANVEVEVEGHTYNVTLIYARGRWGRGVDLENYDVMMIASPALKIPDTVLRAVGKNPYMYPTTYIEASIATVQSCFRIIRRRFYPTPKYVFIDTSLLSSLVYDHYPSWFKRLIHLSDKTRIVKNIELANQIL
ncbi:MAG: hypothetical protein GXO26_01435, partial [Crenarchaeota archaeon]|nr:hypothetical protein [Thermoproteota archaeon]